MLTEGFVVRRRRAWVLPAVATGLVVVSWIALQQDRAPGVDRWARSWVADHQNRQLFTLLDTAKDAGYLLYAGPALLALAAVVSAVRQAPRLFVATGVALVGAALVTYLLKVVVARSGPSGVGPPAVDGAWPSGHAVTATVTALVLGMLLLGRAGLGWPHLGFAILPAVVGAGLVYCGHHWLTDVLVAVPLGYLVVRAAEAVVQLPGPEPRSSIPAVARTPTTTRTAHP